MPSHSGAYSAYRQHFPRPLEPSLSRAARVSKRIRPQFTSPTRFASIPRQHMSPVCAIFGSPALRSLALLLLVAIMAGCGTSGTQRPAQVAAAWPEPPSEGQSLLLFYTQRRDNLRNQPTIYVDEVKVFTLPSDAYSWCYVKPGFHYVSARWEPSRPALNMRTRYLFASGATIYLRLTTDGPRPGSPGLVFAQMHPMNGVVAKMDAERTTYKAPSVTKVGLP